MEKIIGFSIMAATIALILAAATTVALEGHAIAAGFIYLANVLVGHNLYSFMEGN